MREKRVGPFLFWSHRTLIAWAFGVIFGISEQEVVFELHCGRYLNGVKYGRRIVSR